ncbi:iron-sulfur cluster assembly protein [Candidatus Shikimatogenerans bostrichidophilus]|uniref:iron-sulfur cluster assembly protein n=1 Tax=Candidatus Shikimatogenerans bostrichidophilus TaxID=2943807 RepID=UPI002966C6C1
MKNKKKIIKKKIISILKHIYDPEINVNIYDIGLIYNIKVKKNNVIILMTFTSPNCPLSNKIIKNIKNKIKKKIKKINKVYIKITFEPPWNKNMISKKAKLELGLI